MVQHTIFPHLSTRPHEHIEKPIYSLKNVCHVNSLHRNGGIYRRWRPYYGFQYFCTTQQKSLLLSVCCFFKQTTTGTKRTIYPGNTLFNSSLFPNCPSYDAFLPVIPKRSAPFFPVYYSKKVCEEMFSSRQVAYFVCLKGVRHA